jgi:hypothetical protein
LEEGRRLPSTHHQPPGLPQVDLDWRIVDGQPECDGVHVTNPHGPPITSGDLRRLELPKLIREARAHVHAELATQAGRGPASRSQEAKLDQVATIYREAVRRGEPPVVAVAQHFSATTSSPVKAKTASNWVAQARRAGKLPPTTRGAANA